MKKIINYSKIFLLIFLSYLFFKSCVEAIDKEHDINNKKYCRYLCNQETTPEYCDCEN